MEKPLQTLLDILPFESIPTDEQLTQLYSAYVDKIGQRLQAKLTRQFGSVKEFDLNLKYFELFVFLEVSHVSYERVMLFYNGYGSLGPIAHVQFTAHKVVHHLKQHG